MSSFSLIDQPPTTMNARSDMIGGNYDAVLIAAQAGADWAWAMLYRSTGPALLKFLRASGQTHAEEVLGDVFIEAARGVRTFGGDELALRSWLLGIAYRHLSESRPRRPGRAAPATSAGTVFAALEGSPPVPEHIERGHVAAAVRACLSGSPAPEAAPPAFRHLRPVAKFVPAALPSLAAMAALVTAKTLVASAVLLAVAVGGAAVGPAASEPQAQAPAPPAASQPALEAASVKAGFALPARDQMHGPPALRTAKVKAARPQKATKAKKAAAPGAARSVQAHAEAAEHRAEGLARAAEARETSGPKTWVAKPGSAPTKAAQPAAARATAQSRRPAHAGRGAVESPRRRAGHLKKP